MVLAFVVGVTAATLFWLLGPYSPQQLAKPTPGQSLTVNPGKEGALELKKIPPQAVGPRYQMMTDGKDTFLADLQEGRIWRHFHHTREGGFLREEEGFLPLPLFYGGKKYFGAGEVKSATSGKTREEDD